MRYVDPLESTTVNSVPVALTIQFRQLVGDVEDGVKRTTCADCECLPIEGLYAAIHGRQQWRGTGILECHVRRPGDKIRGHCCTTLEVLDGNGLGIKPCRLVIGEITRVLSERCTPVSLRWLLDGSSIKLPVDADAEYNAIVVQSGLVWERASSSGISWRSRIRSPPRVGWEL